MQKFLKKSQIFTVLSGATAAHAVKPSKFGNTDVAVRRPLPNITSRQATLDSEESEDNASETGPTITPDTNLVTLCSNPVSTDDTVTADKKSKKPRRKTVSVLTMRKDLDYQPEGQINREHENQAARKQRDMAKKIDKAQKQLDQRRSALSHWSTLGRGVLGNHATDLKNEARVASISEANINREIIKNAAKKQQALEERLRRVEERLQEKKRLAAERLAAENTIPAAIKIQTAYRAKLERQKDQQVREARLIREGINAEKKRLAAEKERLAAENTIRARCEECEKWEEDYKVRVEAKRLEAEEKAAVIIGESLAAAAAKKANQDAKKLRRMATRAAQVVDAALMGEAIAAQNFEREAIETDELARASDKIAAKELLNTPKKVQPATRKSRPTKSNTRNCHKHKASYKGRTSGW